MSTFCQASTSITWPLKLGLPGSVILVDIEKLHYDLLRCFIVYPIHSTVSSYVADNSRYPSWFRSREYNDDRTSSKLKALSRDTVVRHTLSSASTRVLDEPRVILFDYLTILKYIYIHIYYLIPRYVYWFHIDSNCY